MTVSIFFTMRQMIRSIQGAETDILESVRRIDDVIDNVPKEVNQECGEILENLAFIREELERLDEIAVQLDNVFKQYASGNPKFKISMTDNGGVLVERVD